jgi:hypothetical protein
LLSKWVVPKKYYISFPYGIYDPSIIRPHRKSLLGEQNFFFSYGGKTVRDGLYTSFTMGKEDFLKYRRVIRKEGTGLYVNPPPGQMPREKLPLEERYSAKHFTLDKVFGCATLEGATIVDLPWYFSIDGWQNYCDFLSSEIKIEKPDGILFPRRKWKLIGEKT